MRASVTNPVARPDWWASSIRFAAGTAVRVSADQSIVYLYPGGEGGRGGGPVGRGKIVGIICDQGHVGHRIERQGRVGSAGIDSGRCQAAGRPILHRRTRLCRTASGRPSAGNKKRRRRANAIRQKSASNWLRHFMKADVGARASPCQSATESACARGRSSRKLRHRGETDHAHHSRWLGHQPRRPRKTRRKRRRHFARAHALSRSALSRISGRQA